MPKIPCRVESGPEGGRRGMQKCLRGKGGDFFQRKKVPSLPPAPLPSPKHRSQGEQDHGGGPGEKTTGGHDRHRWKKCGPFAFRLSSPVIERAAPPTARPTQHRGPTWGTGVQGLRRPRHPAASPRLPRPDAGQWPSSDGYSTERKRIYSPPASLPKRQRGRSPRRRPAPLQNRAQHGQPTLPSAAGGMTAKRRRTTGPRRRTWAWRTGCCPHGPGCRHGRAAGCWSPSHAPRA